MLHVVRSQAGDIMRMALERKMKKMKNDGIAVAHTSLWSPCLSSTHGISLPSNRGAPSTQRGRFCTAQAERQLLHCLSRKHP